MIQVSKETVLAYDRRMESAAIAEAERPDFRKWIRFYLDFCQRHSHPPREEASIPAFLTKLASKNQSVGQQEQAARAVKLLLFRSRPAAVRPSPSAPEPSAVAPVRGALTNSATLGAPAPSEGASWEREYRELEDSIKMRGYSGKTLEAYRVWMRKFQSFVRSKPASELTDEDVKAFLTELAVRQGVAASTQNQAFNALLYLYRRVLHREFGRLEGVVRAKRRPYVPVVLSRGEVEAAGASSPRR